MHRLYPASVRVRRHKYRIDMNIHTYIHTYIRIYIHT